MATAASASVGEAIFKCPDVHPNTGDVPKVKRNAESDRQRDIANRGTREVCDDLGTCKTIDNSWETAWRDHSGNVVPGSAGGYPPDYSGQWTQMK